MNIGVLAMQKKMRWYNAIVCLLTVGVILLSLLYIGRDDRATSANITNEIQKKVALTFDDGPDGRYTELLLDGLKERNVRATFFVTGKKAEEFPQIIKRMDEEGHLIGNHTYSHMQLTKGQEEEFKKELQKTSDIIQKLTGKSTEFVRPPYGTWEKRFEDELSMFPVLWTVDPLDWCSKDASKVIGKVVSKVKENDIILMHDQYKSSITAALSIVDTLKKEGYEFVTVDEIILD